MKGTYQMGHDETQVSRETGAMILPVVRSAPVTIIDLVPITMVDRFACALAVADTACTSQLAAEMSDNFRGMIEQQTQGSLSLLEQETLVGDVVMETRRRCVLMLKDKIAEVEGRLGGAH